MPRGKYIQQLFDLLHEFSFPGGWKELRSCMERSTRLRESVQDDKFVIRGGYRGRRSGRGNLMDETHFRTGGRSGDPERFPLEILHDPVLLDLPHRIARELRDDGDLPGTLVRGQPLPAVRGEDLRRDGLPTVFEDDHGGDLLAELLVRQADHRGLPDGLVAFEDVFDLLRVDVVAAGDDQLFRPADQVQPPAVFRILVPEIP